MSGGANLPVLRLRAVAAVFALAIFAALFALSAGADLPALTGRVVDDAHVLSVGERGDLTSKLADLETKSGIQLVVATVPSLGGQDIETYANTLFRAWKLGEATKNNGVLFLVAPQDHRARIEVGYGLEGTLTDATSKLIIANAAAPRFKAGDFDGGVSRAVDDVITVLTTDSADWQKKPELRAEDDASSLDAILPLLVILFILFVIYASRRRGGGVFAGPVIMSSGWGGGGSFGSGGGGFSGGGGSSGGGGASGSW
ncbi:MAG: TPM domain-containing protein [Hyphomicrobiales bacterium]|nr:TPM domain-containing protein [Hyphomicrobiales bacterium]